MGAIFGFTPGPDTPLLASMVKPLLLGNLRFSFGAALTRLRFELARADAQLCALSGKNPQVLGKLRALLPAVAQAFAGDQVAQIDSLFESFDTLCERATALDCELPDDVETHHVPGTLGHIEALCEVAARLNAVILRKRSLAA